MDIGTTGNDYSSDVVSRANYYRDSGLLIFYVLNKFSVLTYVVFYITVKSIVYDGKLKSSSCRFLTERMAYTLYHRFIAVDSGYYL